MTPSRSPTSSPTRSLCRIAFLSGALVLSVRRASSGVDFSSAAAELELAPSCLVWQVEKKKKNARND